MSSLPNGAALTAPVQNIKPIGNFPDWYFFTFTVPVHGSGELAEAMKDGAPNTSEAVWEHMSRMHEEFRSGFSGHAPKKVVLVCFGAFVRQDRFEDFAAQLKERNGLSYMGLRTMLAVGKHHGELCQEKGIRRMRLVSLARQVRHLGVRQVPVLHQEDRNGYVTNALKLEPYEFGWSAEHVFGFECDARR